MTVAAAPPDRLDLSDVISERALAFGRHYEALMTPGRLPLRSEFDVARLSSVIESFVILEPEPGGAVRIRLAGGHEVARYGFEVTGRDYLDFVPPWRRDAARAGFLPMVRTPCGMRTLIVSQRSSGRVVSNEALGLPFRCDRTGAVHLVFQSNDLAEPAPRYGEPETLEVHLDVPERRYIDVGFGLPPAGAGAEEG
jgi:hypothetical protein